MVVLTNSLFQAYLDESGTHARAPILAVAGFFGVHDQWNAFLDNWKHVEFHACEARFDHLKPQLADAIDAAELSGTEVCIRPHEFKALASGDIKAHLGNAYAVSVFLCAAAICERCRDITADARISFIIEDGQPNVRWVQRMLIMMMQEYPIASVGIAKKAAFTQLHAADFLAYSRSATDRTWMDRLFAKKRVNEIPVDGGIFTGTSAAIAEFMKRYRNQKAKEKRERKKGKG